MSDFLEPIESRKRRRRDLESTLASLTKKRERLERAISDHETFDPKRCVDELSQLHFEKARISDAAIQAKKAEDLVLAALAGLRGQAVSLFNVMNYFSADQRLLRSKIQDVETKLKDCRAAIQGLKQERDANSQLIDRNTSAMGAFKSFDAAASQAELRRLRGDIEAATAELAAVEEEIHAINRKVGPSVAEYETLKAKICNIRTTIAAAEQMERELSKASNSYEKRQVHQKCEQRFGEGSPRRVASASARELRSIENNLPKLERRIRDELRRLEIVVSHVIIDGNNVCYERSNFIRFRALTHLVDKLVQDYKVTVVFDASIRSLMQTDDAGIRRIIQPPAEVYVAPTKAGADEFIVKLAEGRLETYVLTNDRFAEFGDYDAVRTGRLLRFMIADNRVMINDLDIAVPFH